jgi:transcriptional regulator with XRE-family HTH domain
MVAMRRLIGEVLRRTRQRQERTLRDVAAAAQVSLGYLSEVERGQKEASSELLSSICDALGTPLSSVLREVADELAMAELATLTNSAPAAGPLAGHQPPVTDSVGGPVGGSVHVAA